MNFSINSPITIASAAPGSVVKLDNVTTHVFPVVAWAVVSHGFNPDGDHDTEVEAVFVYEGSPYTESQWRRDFKGLGLEVMA